MNVMRRRLACAAAALATAPAFGQTPRRSYALVSEMARELVFVGWRPSVGSRLNSDANISVPVKDGAFDRAAVLTASKAVREADPGASTWAIAPMDSSLFPSGTTFSAGQAVKIPDDMAAEMKPRGSTHLLLFTPLRAEAALKGASSTLGSGNLSGLGIYVDSSARMYQQGGRFARGYLAPYLYAGAVLVEVPSGTVLAVRRITSNSLFINTRDDTDGTTAWDSITQEEKLKAMLELVQEEVAASVKALLPPR